MLVYFISFELPCGPLVKHLLNIQVPGSVPRAKDASLILTGVSLLVGLYLCRKLFFLTYMFSLFKHL